MDFGGFFLFGCIALIFLAYIPIVILAYIQKSKKLWLHISLTVAISTLLIVSGLFLRQVYFLDEPLAIAASQGDVTKHNSCWLGEHLLTLKVSMECLPL